MDTLCWDPISIDDVQATGSDGSMTYQTEGILECDYDTQCTKLYKIIEDKQWEEVLYYLDSGHFYDTSIFSTMCGKEPDSPSIQTRTWITALDDSGNVRWCQLPLHAAVTFCAPFSVISKLVEIYPRSVRCADDQDMLPLHYAFRFGAEDDVLAFLLEEFPKAVGKKAVKGRLPLDMAQYGSKPERGIIIEYYVENAVRSAKAEWDNEYEKIVSEMNTESNSALARELASKRQILRETEKELAEAREEIEVLRGKMGLEARKRSFTNTSSLPKMKSRKNQVASYDHHQEEASKKSDTVEFSVRKTAAKLRGLIGKRRNSQTYEKKLDSYSTGNLTVSWKFKLCKIYSFYRVCQYSFAINKNIHNYNAIHYIF